MPRLSFCTSACARVYITAKGYKFDLVGPRGYRPPGGGTPQPQASDKKPCPPPQTGIGAGLLVGGSGTTGTGPGAGATATGSVGGGVYYNSSSGLSLGGFRSGGATAYAGSPVAGAPQQLEKPFAMGASGGGGVGVYFTNAGSAQQQAGPFFQIGGVASIVSIDLANARGVWVLSITVGKGAGLSGSALTTNTKAAGTGCP